MSADAAAGLLNKALVFGGGFFVYVANLLCFVRVPPEVNKPLLAAIFASVGLLCALIALLRTRFAHWQRKLASIIVSAALLTVAAVTAIALLRSSSTMRQHAAPLNDFTDYRTGAIVSIALLFGAALLYVLAPPWRDR